MEYVEHKEKGNFLLPTQSQIMVGVYCIKMLFGIASRVFKPG